MTKQTIEVDVPNGYEISKIEYFSDSQFIKVRIKEKIKPREIRLIETDEDNIRVDGEWCRQYFCNGLILFQQPKRWREVKETDIPLTNEEPKLSLSVDEAKSIFGCDFTLLVKIEKFVKENS